MDMTLEAVTIPVSDTEQAKDFYANTLGFTVDMDVQVSESLRFVQLTPPGSPCSIHLGEGTSGMTPGILKGLILVVDSVEAAKAALETRGVRLSEIDEQPWGRHVYFTDPDGNAWTLQESFARAQRKAATGQ
jgi:catechol 2,3-dioxygenase-like lactoylglutathione lyase family enzyme